MIDDEDYVEAYRNSDEYENSDFLHPPKWQNYDQYDHEKNETINNAIYREWEEKHKYDEEM